MFRSMSRIATVAVVALTLVLASVPAAQASPLSGLSLDNGSNWFDMALTWLNGLFGEETSSPTSTFENAGTGDDPNLLLGGGYTVQSGSCINPDGRPRPCDL